MDNCCPFVKLHPWRLQRRWNRYQLQRYCDYFCPETMSNYIWNCFLERIPLKPNEICVTTGLSVNGRLFIAPREHLDSLVSIIYRRTLACSRRSDIAGRSEVRQAGEGGREEEERERERVGNVALTSYQPPGCFSCSYLFAPSTSRSERLEQARRTWASVL